MKFVKYMMLLAGFVVSANMFGMSQALLEDQAIKAMEIVKPAAQCGAQAACQLAQKATGLLNNIEPYLDDSASAAAQLAKKAAAVVKEAVPSVWDPAKKALAKICVNVGAGLKNAGCKIIEVAPGVLGYMLGEVGEATGFLKRAPVITTLATGLVVYGGYKAYYGIKDWWNAPQQNRRR